MKAAHKLVTTVRGPRVEVDLSPLTVIAGPNESRKTAMLEAYRLALTRKCSVGKQAKAIAALNDSDEVFAGLEAEDWSAGTRVETGDKGSKKVVHRASGSVRGFTEQELDEVLPTVHLRDLLTFGQQKSREALIRKFGEGLDEVPQPDGLSSLEADCWRGAQKICNPVATRDATKVLADMGSHFRSEVLQLGRRIGHLEKSVIDLREGLAKRGMERLELRELQIMRDQAVAASSIARVDKQLEDTRAELAEASKHVERTEAELQKAEEARKQVAPEKQAIDEEVAQLDAEIERRRRDPAFLRHQRAHALAEIAAALEAAGQDAPCPLCCTSRSASAWPVRAQKAIERREQRKQEVQAIEAEIRDLTDRRDAKVQKALHLTSEADFKVNSAAGRARATRIHRDGLKSTIERLEAAKGEAAAYTGPSVEELDARVKQLREADTMRQRLEQEAEELEQLRRRRDAMKNLQSLIPKVSRELLTELKERAEAAVNRYMPEGRAVLDLEKSEWLVEDDKGIPRTRAHSAGKRLGTLALALLLGFTDGAQARIVLLDDEDLKHFDEAALYALLHRLGELQASGEILQVLAAVKTQKPQNLLLPEGWTLTLAPGIRNLSK